MLSAKATLLMVSGRFDEAQSYSRRAIGKNPSDVSAYKSLVQSTSGRLSNEELSALESLVDREELRLADRAPPRSRLPTAASAGHGRRGL